MTEATFAGRISRGEFSPDLADQWHMWQIYNEGKRIVVTVDLERQHRSLAQNRRYWSLIVPVAAEVLNTGRDIPFSRDQVHEVLKLAFIGHEDTLLGPVPKSSKQLTTEQFRVFCSDVEEWLLHKFGCVLPERGEER